MKMLILTYLLLLVVAGCQATTLVHFSPSPGYSGDGPAVAPGFAYAFSAPVFDNFFNPHAFNIIQDHSHGRYAADQWYDHVGPSYTHQTYNVQQQHPLVPQVTKTQYHSQDELGQYAYGYVHNDASHHEERTADGRVRGSYSYYDDNGIKQSTNYVADRGGFRVSTTNLPISPPVAVRHTPEVEAATRAHLQAVRDARTVHHYGLHVHAGIAETPEVAAARAAHLQAFNRIKQERARRFKRNAHYTGFPHSHPHSTYYTNQSPSIHPTFVQSYSSPIVSYSSVAPPPYQVLSQYHSQDEFGQYSYGYSGGPSEKHEQRGLDGVTRGYYAYRDAYGNLQRVEYEADDYTGFKIISATNLPQAVHSTY